MWLEETCHQKKFFDGIFLIQEKQGVVDYEKIIQRYDAYLRIEKGLSANTAQSYCHDVDHLARFVDSIGKWSNSYAPCTTWASRHARRLA